MEEVAKIVLGVVGRFLVNSSEELANVLDGHVASLLQECFEVLCGQRRQTADAMLDCSMVNVKVSEQQVVIEVFVR